MIFTKTEIEELYVIQLEPRNDSRGYFSRNFCKNELAKIGVKFDIAQTNRSLSLKKGTIRGLHFQKFPKSESKIVQCIKGSIFDVVLDLRPDSKTYKKWVGKELSAKNMTLMLIPKGCAHGFQTLEENSVVEYFVDEFYSPKYESGVRWDDPAIGINWPISEVYLSEKDKKLPGINDL